MSALAKTEVSELVSCEQVIERGRGTFIEVGNALLKIRDGKLYRGGYKTFELYCNVRWSMKHSQAYRLIDAANTMGVLKSSPIGELPASESIARPLTKLLPAAQKEVWDEAVQTAPEGKVTAQHVEATVKRWDQGSNSIKPVSDEAKNADNQSDALFQLKRWWKKASKKDHKQFLRWAKSLGAK